MPAISNKDRCIDYLKQYEAKDLAAMNTMFADDIILRDWKIRVVGKEWTMTETRRNFEAADSIQMNILAMHQDSDFVPAELRILVNETEELYVVEAIIFDNVGEISSIRTYPGRGNKQARLPECVKQLL